MLRIFYSSLLSGRHSTNSYIIICIERQTMTKQPINVLELNINLQKLWVMGRKCHIVSGRILIWKCGQCHTKRNTFELRDTWINHISQVTGRRRRKSIPERGKMLIFPENRVGLFTFFSYARVFFLYTFQITIFCFVHLLSIGIILPTDFTSFFAQNLSVRQSVSNKKSEKKYE